MRKAEGAERHADGSRVLWVMGFALLLGLFGCSRESGDAASAAAAKEPPVIPVSKPIQREIVDYDSYTGLTEAEKTVEVRSRVRGEIKKVLFTPGETVKEGQILFQIDEDVYRATLDSAKAKRKAADAAVQLANVEYNRTRGLVAKGGAAAADLEMWTAKKAAAQADGDLADAEIKRADLDVGYCTIKAPITGRIGRPLVDLGNLVNAGGGDQLLTTIVSVRPIFMYFDVDEQSLLRYQTMRIDEAVATKGNGDKQSLKEKQIPVAMGLANTQGSKTDDERFPFKGYLDFAENRLDPTTGTLRVRAVFPNEDNRLTPGLFGRVRIPISKPYPALLVNDRALSTEQGQKFLYIVGGGDKVEKRLVRPGRLIDSVLRVFPPGAGLEANDLVVVDAVQRVQPSMIVRPEIRPMPELPAAPAAPPGPPAKNGKPSDKPAAPESKH